MPNEREQNRVETGLHGKSVIAHGHNSINIMDYFIIIKSSSRLISKGEEPCAKLEVEGVYIYQGVAYFMTEGGTYCADIKGKFTP